ncbi:LytR family transcriptional regulator, partial [Streptomyces sp. NPDC059744]
MTGDKRRGRSRRLKAAAAVVGCILVLAAAGAGWAYWHLNQNIRSVDIDSALGDDRPARAPVTVPTTAPSASPRGPAAPPPPRGGINHGVGGAARPRAAKPPPRGGGPPG